MSEFRPRTTPPDTYDLRWISNDPQYGGYNRCIVINSATGSVLPNCTGYVHGRWMEESGINECPLSVSNAANYYGYTADGMPRGSEPALGAVICFSTGQGGQPGHVAIVEEIIDADTIVTSDSNYGAEYFVTRTRYRSMGWNWWAGSDLVFQGFIYNPNLKNYNILLLAAAARKRRKEEEENGKSIRIQQYSSSL
jgi:hypothetical protein